MIGFVRVIRGRRAMRRFLTALPRHLRRDYGHRGPYTPEQVEATIRRHKVTSPSFAHYAQAIFCDRESVERLWRERGSDLSFDDARAEIANAYFGGQTDFTEADTARYSSESSGHGADAGHGVHANDSSSHGGGHH
jgi:hypothetical protein